MKETLRKFRLGAVNVLLSTSVVEEGMDVSFCPAATQDAHPQAGGGEGQGQQGVGQEVFSSGGYKAAV